MADLNFPNPGVQQTYTFVGKTWNWDGQRWAFASSGSGITKLNELTSSVQNFLIGYSGAFPNILSSGTDHTFNFPIAGTAATGLVNTSAQTFAGAKTFASTTNATYIGVGGVVVHGGIAISGNAAIGGSAIFTNTSNTNTIAFRAGIQGSTLSYIFPIDTPTAGQVLSASAPSSGVVTLSWEDDQTGAPAGGITQLNGLTAATQSFQTGTDGVDFGISSTTATHTFNLPDASASARGVITTGSQTIAGAKTFSSSIVGNLTGTATTSENVNVTTTTRSLTHYLTFTSATSGSGLALTTSAVGIGFTVNPAQNTLAAGTFIGNLSGTAATATNFYGSLVGNVTGTATTAQNVNVTTTTLSNNFYLTFANASSGSGLALTTSAVGMGLTYNPATNTLSAQLFTGTAFTARNSEVTTTTRSSDHYLLFANASSGTGLGLSTSAVGMGLTYNPATNTLSAQFFTGTATTSRNVDVTTTTRSFTHYLTFTNASSGSGLALTTSTIGIGFTVNPSQNTLAAGTFIGNLSGTAATATNFYGTLVGNSSTATTSQNVNTVVADTAGNHYLTFSPANGGSGVALSTDGGLAFVPTTNVLTTGVFSGNLSATGATVTTIFDAQGDVSLGNATGDTVTFNARIGSHFNPSSDATYDLGLPSFSWRNAYLDFITGTAVTATNFYGTLTGNSSTATTSANLNTVAATTGTGHYILFSPTNGASGVAVSSDAQLQFSPSTNVLTADIFSGNLSGTAATATNFYGSLTGNVTGTATTAQNVNVTTTTAGGNFYLTFTNQSSGSGLALTTSTIGIGFTVNPAQNTLAAGTFIGNLSGAAVTATNFFGALTGNVTGTATTSQNVNVTTTTRSSTHYILFANATNGSGLALTTSSVGVGFTVNPSQNTLAAGTFIGNLSGTAATATNFYGTLVGNSSTATTSQNINVNTTTAGGSFYLTFTNQSSGSGLALTTSTIGIGFTVNPAQNTLAAGTFIGNLSGTAATVTNFYGTLTGNVTGTATTAQNVNLATGANNTNHSVVFSLNSSGTGVGLSSDASLLYNPSTNVLTSDVFSGNFTGTAATATNFYGTLTGNVTGTATTAQNLNTVAAATGTGHYLLFSPTNGGSGIAVSSDAQLQFSPATNVLTADIFSGNLSGTAATATNFYGTLVGNSSTATTSQNINVNTTTAGGNFYLTFTNQSSGSGLALTTSTIGIGFTVNPAQNTLAAGTFVGNLSGTAVTAGILKVTSTSGTALNIADRVTVYTVDNSEGLNINSNYSYALSVQDKSNNNRFIVDVSNSRTIFTGNSADHELRIYNSNQSSYTGFKANSTGTITYILPPGKPSTGSSILQSDDSGNMIWVPMTSGLSSAITSINSQTGPSITLQTGSSGSDFAISQSGNTITFNLPDASASNRGLVTNGTQTIAGSKTFSSTISGNLSGTATTSQNINVNTTTAGGSFYLTFTNQSSGSGLALTTSTIGIGFTVNPAQNTLAAGTFIGNLSGTAVTATNFYGTHIGNVTGTATTSQNVNVTTTTAGGNFYLTFTNQSSGSGLALTTSAIGIGFTVNPAQNTLAAGTFIGNLSGAAVTATNFYGTLTGNSSTATTSGNINTVAATTGTGHYILFSPVNGASGVAVSSDAQLLFSPSTNVLTADIFSGNLSGTAATATNFYGSLVGTATTSQNVNVNTTTAGGNFYLTFTNQSSGSGLALTTSTIGIGFTVNPAQNTLAAGTFIGNLSGTAVTATNFFGSLTGTATTSQNVNVNTTTSGVDHYLLFSNRSSGSGVALTTSTVGMGLTYNPATNTLSAQFFTGTASTSRNSVINSTTISSDHYLLFANASSGSGLALSASAVGMGLTYNPATNTLSAQFFTGTATTARNVVVNTTTRSANHYLLFSPDSSGSGVALTTSTVGMGLTYNPATNTLSAQFFTGTATTARNVDVTSTTAGGTHYLTFTNATSGSGLALTTSTIGIGFTVNPAQNTLAAGTFIGNVSGSATTSTYITGILRNASYVLGDLLAGASTGNTLTRVPVGANNRYFLKPDSTTQSGLGWSTFAGVFVTSLAPASPAFTLVKGDLWYKVDDGSFNVYYDVDETAQWVEIVSSGGPGGGTATTSENVNVNTTTINQNHYLLFSNRSSGSGVALTTSTIGIGFTVNPAENSLSAGLFAGNISGIAATFANIYGNTFGSLTGVEFSGGDVLIKTGKSLKIYEANNVYNTSFKANSSLAGNTDYTLPVGKPGTGASILQSDTAGSMIWVKAASNKATYVLSFGAGFTPTTGLDSVSIAIPYANDGSTSLTYTIKRVEVRTETAPGASTLAFFFERHTTGDVTWASANTIKGAASANFSVASANFSSSFTTITSSSGNNGEVASGNYLRVNFASVGSAANVSISIMIQEN